MLKPVNSKVIIEEVKEQEKTVGGIILPGETKKPCKTGIVAAIEESQELTAGQKVVFDAYDGIEVEDEGKKYLVIDFDKILAIVEA